MPFTEFERLLKVGDPFATGVLLTGCVVDDYEDKYGILNRGFQPQYSSDSIINNILTRYRLAWIRFCVFGNSNNQQSAVLLYQWVITTMQVLLLNDFFPLDRLLYVGLLGDPRYVIHRFSKQYDGFEEHELLQLLQVAKKQIPLSTISEVSVYKILARFRRHVNRGRKNLQPLLFQPGNWSTDAAQSVDAIISAYLLLSPILNSLRKGDTHIGLGYGVTTIEIALLDVLAEIEKAGFSTLDYLILTDMTLMDSTLKKSKDIRSIAESIVIRWKETLDSEL